MQKLDNVIQFPSTQVSQRKLSRAAKIEGWFVRHPVLTDAIYYLAAAAFPIILFGGGCLGFFYIFAQEHTNEHTDKA